MDIPLALLLARMRNKKGEEFMWLGSNHIILVLKKGEKGMGHVAAVGIRKKGGAGLTHKHTPHLTRTHPVTPHSTHIHLTRDREEMKNERKERGERKQEDGEKQEEEEEKLEEEDHHFALAFSLLHKIFLKWVTLSLNYTNLK